MMSTTNPPPHSAVTFPAVISPQRVEALRIQLVNLYSDYWALRGMHGDKDIVKNLDAPDTFGLDSLEARCRKLRDEIAHRDFRGMAPLHEQDAEFYDLDNARQQIENQITGIRTQCESIQNPNPAPTSVAQQPPTSPKKSKSKTKKQKRRKARRSKKYSAEEILFQRGKRLNAKLSTSSRPKFPRLIRQPTSSFAFKRNFHKLTGKVREAPASQIAGLQLSVKHIWGNEQIITWAAGGAITAQDIWRSRYAGSLHSTSNENSNGSTSRVVLEEVNRIKRSILDEKARRAEEEEARKAKEEADEQDGVEEGGDDENDGDYEP